MPMRSVQQLLPVRVWGNDWMGDRAQVAAPATSDRASWEPGKGNVATVGQVEVRVLEHGGWLERQKHMIRRRLFDAF
jgi:hypothetical protein